MKKLKVRKAIVCLLATVSLITLAPITAHAEWRSNNGRWWYATNNGSSYYANDWYNLNGNWYYFGANGYMQTGWIQDGGNWYYCGSNGAMLTNQYIGSFWVGASGAWETAPTNDPRSKGAQGQITTGSNGKLSDNMNKSGN